MWGSVYAKSKGAIPLVRHWGFMLFTMGITAMCAYLLAHYLLPDLTGWSLFVRAVLVGVVSPMVVVAGALVGTGAGAKVIVGAMAITAAVAGAVVMTVAGVIGLAVAAAIAIIIVMTVAVTVTIARLVAKKICGSDCREKNGLVNLPKTR